MSRTYSSLSSEPFFFSRYVIGSKITRRIVQVSLPKICRFLTLFSSFTFSLFLSRSLSFSLMPLIHSHIYRDRPYRAWSFEIVVSNYDISTRYLYIYIPVGSSLAYTILPFCRIHSFVEGGEGVSFVYDYKAFYFITTLPKAFPQGSAMRADVCELRKIYFFPYIF